MEANNTIYFANAGQYEVFTIPKASDWQCHLFGSERGIIYTPLEGSQTQLVPSKDAGTLLRR